MFKDSEYAEKDLTLEKVTVGYMPLDFLLINL